jgi:hypothetical protein
MQEAQTVLWHVWHHLVRYIEKTNGFPRVFVDWIVVETDKKMVLVEKHPMPKNIVVSSVLYLNSAGLLHPNTSRSQHSLDLFNDMGRSVFTRDVSCEAVNGTQLCLAFKKLGCVFSIESRISNILNDRPVYLFPDSETEVGSALGNHIPT